MLGTVCGQAVPEQEMSRDVGEGSSVRPRDPGTLQKYPTAKCIVLPNTILPYTVPPYTVKPYTLLPYNPSLDHSTAIYHMVGLKGSCTYALYPYILTLGSMYLIVP